MCTFADTCTLLAGRICIAGLFCLSTWHRQKAVRTLQQLRVQRLSAAPLYALEENHEETGSAYSSGMSADTLVRTRWLRSRMVVSGAMARLNQSPASVSSVSRDTLARKSRPPASSSTIAGASVFADSISFVRLACVTMMRLYC